MTDHIEPGASAPTFDARGFLAAFEAEGGKVYSDGRSFAVVFPSDADLIPTQLIEWGAVIAEAHDRAIYGERP